MKLHIFMGYDEREPVPFSVAVQSLKDNSKTPNDIVVHPLYHKDLRAKGYFNRQWLIKEDGSYEDVKDGKPFSVQFSHSRFLTPFLAKKMGIYGPVMFVDCDFIFLTDVAKLFDFCREEMYKNDYPVMLVKHEYHPQNTRKMDNSVQTDYSMKLWSAMMMFDTRNKACDVLNPDTVNNRPGSWLHQFKWLDNPEKQIGALPETWNYVPGHSTERTGVLPKDADAIHYTEGGPWFSQYEDCYAGDIWTRYFYRMNTFGLPR